MVLTESGQSVQCEILTESGQSAQCEVLTESGLVVDLRADLEWAECTV